MGSRATIRSTPSRRAPHPTRWCAAPPNPNPNPNPSPNPSSSPNPNPNPNPSPSPNPSPNPNPDQAISAAAGVREWLQALAEVASPQAWLS